MARLHEQPRDNLGDSKMPCLYAQPYDISATGFYFECVEEYRTKRDNCKNDFGGQVEEFEIQFIDGEDIDVELFQTLNINQATFSLFFEKVEDWSELQKQKVIIAVGECGYDFDFESNNPDDFDIDLYEVDSLKELAEQFVDEGIFGDIPDNIQCYLDYDAIARDLGMDYCEICINGTNYVYRCI